MPSATMTPPEPEFVFANDTLPKLIRKTFWKRFKKGMVRDAARALAAEQGFTIDSLTLLRSWSTVKDFSKPTWFGWFDD